MKSVYIWGFSALVLSPQIVFGQTASGLVTCTGFDCNVCQFVQLINNLVTWLFGFLVLVAVLLIVYAGFKLVVSGGNPGAMSDAKGMLSNVIIGFVIIMAAWLIVDTMLKALVSDEIDLGMWNGIRSSDCGGFNTTLPSTGQEQGGGLTTGGDTATDPNQLTDAEARALLASNPNIEIWESAPGRTQLGGINAATLNEVTRIQQACNCTVTITGGTESGHADGTYSHSNGYKIDIDDTSAVNNYLTSTYVQSGSRNDGTILYTDPNRPGVEYAREGDHWDITVK